MTAPTEATLDSPTLTATFTVAVFGIRTRAVGNLTDVIKRVDFTIKGTEQGQSFELPQSVEIADPNPEQFIQLANVTEANVIAWVEENFTNMDGVKAHIQYVLDKQIAEAAFASQPLPWAPAPEPAPTV